MNYPRRHARRNTSSDSLTHADLSGPRRSNSNELSFYGESSRDLLEFSRYLDKNEVVEEDDHPKVSPEQSFAYLIGSNSFPKVLSRRSSFHAGGSPTSPASADGEIAPPKTPRSIEMTNTSPGFGDIFVPPFLDEKCSPRTTSHRSHRDDSSYCCSASFKSRSSLKSLESSPDLKKVPPTVARKPPARTASESVAHCRTSTVPSRGSVRRAKSSDDSSSFSSSHCSPSPRCRSTHSLRWDRTLVQVVPGYSLPLAGLQESIAAYQRQAVQEALCQACQTELFCIDSASIVLCPMCRTFSPICTNDDAVDEYDHGESSEQLGLGLTAELLAEELSKL